MKLPKLTKIFVLKKNRYLEIAIDKLEPHPLQPRTRAMKERVTDLLRTILESSMIDAPVVMSIPGRPGYYWVCNGNRRVATAKLLGLTRLECKLLPKGSSGTEEWITHNSGAKNISGIDMLTAIGYTKSAKERAEVLKALARTRHTLANQIQKMAEILGWSTVCRLGRTESAATNRVTRFNDVLKYGRLFGRLEVNDRNFQRKILLWFYTFDAYNEVGIVKRVYFETGNRRSAKMFDAILSCIRENRPFILSDYLT